MLCIIDGCDGPIKARGLCGKHYHRWERHGDPRKTEHRLPGMGSFTFGGYKEQSVDGRRMLEHRRVMEEFLGRRLSRWEIVHHKDHNKLNNDISNLEVLTMNTHNTHHHLRRFISETHAECTKCHVIKPHDEFSPNRAANSNLKRQTRCKKCKAAYYHERKAR